MSLVDRLRRYAAAEDPAAAAANLIALVLAWNGPLYPLYVLWIAGWGATAAWGSALASPWFFAVPWLTRRNAGLGKLALVIVGTANTIWCVKLFGPGSGVGLFFYPCIALAALLHRPGERVLFGVAAGLPLAAYFLPLSIYGAPLLDLSVGGNAALAALNGGSVAILGGFSALQFVRVIEARRLQPETP